MAASSISGPWLHHWTPFFFFLGVDEPLLYAIMIGLAMLIPVMMMIGIFAGVPFMGIVDFIIGPVLVALAVTDYKIPADEVGNPKNLSFQG